MRTAHTEGMHRGSYTHTVHSGNAPMSVYLHMSTGGAHLILIASLHARPPWSHILLAYRYNTTRQLHEAPEASLKLVPI